MKKTVILPTIIFFICLIFATLASADDNIIITDFTNDNTQIAWKTGDAISGVDVIDDVNAESSRDKVLSAKGETAGADIIRTVVAQFEPFLDLSEFKSFSTAMYIDSISRASDFDAFARIVFVSADGERHENISRIESGSWNDIECDISAYTKRSTISSIEFGIVPSHIENGVWDGGFLLDDLVAGKRIDLSLSNRFSFEKYNVYGGVAEFSTDKSYFDLIPAAGSKKVSMEFDIPIVVNDFDDTIRISLENKSETENFKIVLLRGDERTPEEYTVQLKGESTIEVATQKLNRVESIKGIRLEIPVKEGKIRIRSIGFTSEYDKYEYITYGDVSACRISNDGKYLSISGELGRKYVTEFEGLEFRLYALELTDNARTFDYESETPIATHGISTKFSFKVPTEILGAAAKFKKYVVKISTSPMVFVDTPAYVESYHQSTYGPMELGLAGENTDVVCESLSEATVFEVEFQKLIARERSGQVYYSDGNNYYFDKDYVEYLDKVLYTYKASCMNVSFRLLIGSDSIQNMVYNGANMHSDSYMANIKNEECRNTIKAMVEFLTERYGCKKDGFGVDSFIIARSVNKGAEEYGAPVMSMTELVQSYADIMRFVYICANSVSDNIRVYASVDGVGEYTSLLGKSNRFSTNAFVDALNTYISDEGNFPWGICVEQTSSSLEDLIIPQKVPGMLISHLGSSVLSIKKVLESIIETTDTGRFQRHIISLKNAPSYNSTALKMAKAYLSNDKQMLQLLGADIKKYESLVKEKKLQQRTYLNSDAATKLAFTPIGKYRFFGIDSYSTIEKVSPAYNTKAIKHSLEKVGERMLIAKYDESKAVTSLFGMAVSFDKPQNFKHTPVLSFGLRITGTDFDGSIPVILRFTGKNGVYDVRADVLPWESQNIYVDMSAVHDETYNFVQILADAGSCDNIELSLGEIAGYSATNTDEELKILIESDGERQTEKRLNPVIIAAFAVIITVLLTITVMLKLRLKKADKE